MKTLTKARKVAWKALWAEFDKWSEEKEPFPAWPTQQTQIKNLVQSQMIPKGITVQWRHIWAGFNEVCLDGDWEGQKSLIAHLVENEIERQENK